MISLTETLLAAYGILCLVLLMRVISLMLAGEKKSMSDVKNIMIFPLLLMTKHGRADLNLTLSEIGQTK